MKEAAKVQDGKLNIRGRIHLVCIIGDTLASLTALTIGIVSIIGLLQGVPVAAAYTLIGISGLITLAWILSLLDTRGTLCIYTKNLLTAAITSNPKMAISWSK